MIIAGAKDGLAPALVIGLARGIQWILTASAIIDPIINSISKPLMAMPKYLTPIAVMIVIALFNGLITSGSAKAMALMPILIPLADLVGMTRRTMILAFQFGDGLTNSAWFTSGTLLIFLTIAGIPLKKWWKFVTPLLLILTVVCVIALLVATKNQLWSIFDLEALNNGCKKNKSMESRRTGCSAEIFPRASRKILEGI